MNLSWATVRNGLVHRGKVVRWLTIAAMCLVVALPIGAVIGGLDFMYGSAAIIALTIGYLMLRSTMLGLVAMIAIICLLPFAALPFDIGFSPTFLDLVLVVVFFVWISRVATHREDNFMTDPPTLPLLLFTGLAVASFVLGINNASLNANLLRHFIEIILSLLVFLLVINVIRSAQQLRIIIIVLMAAGTLAALIGIVLYFLPDYVAVRLLSMLRIVRYPAGSGVLRYVEDNPQLALRAISTSVDPNVLGGMLIFTTTLAASQALADKPIIPRLAAYAMAGILVLCMVLTYSRGSFVGLAAALFCLGIRYPRKAVWFLLAGVAFIFLPPAQNYINHFVEGLQQRDLATQMRLGEYKDAFRLIQRYPWFGVGFGGTPDSDLYLGVSSVYLLIGSEMGIVGLLSFLIILITYLVRFVTLPFRAIRGTALESLALGTTFAVVGAMVGGVFDHYLFNLVFPHAAALLWLMVGLGTVSFRLARQQAAETQAVV
ncbi:MAG: O-antigen ligase family protein [Anaerolineae bacterium]